MATQPNTAADQAPANDSKTKNVLDDMKARAIFSNTDDAANYIMKCQESFPDFGGYPIVFVGQTEDGDFDPEIYNDSMDVAVVKLTARGEGSGKDYEGSVVKAIVIFPSPKLSAILESESATAWLTGIMQKELNHVAVRGLRKAGEKDQPTIAEAAEAMPTTIEAYITSNREAGSGILETYNELWRVIKSALGQKFKIWNLTNFSKKELRKAMESSAYAAAVYPKLELRENKKTGERESLLEIALNFGVLLAKEQGLDPAFFERALADRAEAPAKLDDEDDEDFDLEAMAIEALAEAPAETPTEEATDEAPAEAPAE